MFEGVVCKRGGIRLLILMMCTFALSTLPVTSSSIRGGGGGGGGGGFVGELWRGCGGVVGGLWGGNG